VERVESERGDLLRQSMKGDEEGKCPTARRTWKYGLRVKKG